ncbi:hypothetical protein HY634_03525 [Candidatus Uhrbacteria bacterium]|nr:hypothetical protein [Candidatus Uhrbacteria bacterium]
MGFERYTGRMYERDYLGAVEPSPAYQQRLAELARGRTADKDGGPLISYNDALRLAREFQPGDPTNPPKELTRELRLAVIDALHVPEDQLDRVRAFTAVGTRGDVLHGIDAFIDFQDPASGQTHTVVIDLTQNAQKASETSIAEVRTSARERDVASIIVGELPAPNDPRFLDLVGEVGTVVAEQLRLLQQYASPRGRRAAA